MTAATSRPRIALTVGDVAGIGPELVAAAVSDRALRDSVRPLVVGHPEILRRALRLIRSDVAVLEVDDPATAVDDSDDCPELVACWNPGSADVLEVAAGQVDPRAGRAACDYLVHAIQAALAGQVDAITTAPLNKLALHAAGLPHPGHTEILAEMCGVRDYAMMLYLPPGEGVAAPHGLGVAHATLHTSIASVPGRLSIERIDETIDLVHGFMQRLGCHPPRIGVCALNPHAGEGGLFGDEEIRLIRPAVEAARSRSINADGPYGADTLLLRAVHGEFDGVAAMYHDQGHIALKLLAFDRAVNVTLGLPIIRTSPSQGTAFDIAWQGVARPEGMREAIKVAARLVTSSD